MKSDEHENRIYLKKENISDLPDQPGVYFLYQKGNVLVYIGIAISLKKRVIQHDADKEFNRIGYEHVHYSRARKLEKNLLSQYKKDHDQLPFYNRQT
jgi:excinuclease UvrABC nuclease subunit